MNFTGKVVLITGASSGIGYATAIHFAKLGATLAVTGRNIEALQKLLTECKAFNIEPLIIQADLTNESDVTKIITNTIAKFKKLDVLINNAGVLEVGSIESTDLSQYDRVFNINVRSMYHLTNLAVPYLIETKGNIVNVSSLAGVRSFRNAVAYSMSKAAIDQFTKCTALDLASKGVRVNSVNPGIIVTDIFTRAGMNNTALEEYLEHSKKTHPLGRVGTVDEVANGITFLSSDLASFTTGVNLSIDGGRIVMCVE